MWAVSPILPAPPFSKTTSKPLIRPFVVILPRSASAPPQNDGEDIGGIGHTLLTPANSYVNSEINRVPKRQEGQQLSGSDVLWALQRAAAKKNKKNRKRRELSTAGSKKEDDNDDVDHSNVKPLCIKSRWAVKLKELEKRLQELSDID